jgi:transcription antitermination factor NusG
VQAEYRGEGFQEGVLAMEQRQFTFGSADQAEWLDPKLIGEVVWRDGVPYRVLGIYFGGKPGDQDDRLYQWWIGEKLHPSDVPRWYALEVDPGRERDVEAALDEACVTCLLPCLFFGSADPKKDEEGSVEYLFPGYVFVRLAPADPMWGLVAKLPAVRGVVGFGGKPVPLPDELPNALIDLSLGSGYLVYRGDRLMDYGASPPGAELAEFLSRPPDSDGRVRFLLDFLVRGCGGFRGGQTLETLAVGSAFGQ